MKEDPLQGRDEWKDGKGGRLCRIVVKCVCGWRVRGVVEPVGDGDDDGVSEDNIVNRRRLLHLYLYDDPVPDRGLTHLA